MNEWRGNLGERNRARLQRWVSVIRHRWVREAKQLLLAGNSLDYTLKHVTLSPVAERYVIRWWRNLFSWRLPVEKQR